eukprot:1861241-Ditylum_brightwellii.AAC.1
MERIKDDQEFILCSACVKVLFHVSKQVGESKAFSALQKETTQVIKKACNDLKAKILAAITLEFKALRLEI